MDLTNLNRDRKTRYKPTLSEEVKSLKREIIDRINTIENNHNVQIDIKVTWVGQETHTGFQFHPEVSITGITNF